MNNFFKVVGFELNNYFKSKAYILTTVLITAFLIVGICLPSMVDLSGIIPQLATEEKAEEDEKAKSEEDKSNNDIDISGLNMRPQLTERTSRDRPLFVKITKINKEDEDDIDIFANIKSEKTNKTLNNDINNAIRIVKSRNNHSAYKQCNTSYSNENVIKLGRSPNELSKYKSRINHLLTQKKKKEFIQLRDHSEDKDNFA